MNEIDLAIRRYAESHPRPVHVTQTQAAEMLGVSRPYISTLIRSGKVKLNGCGLIPIKYLDDVIAG